MPGWLWWFLEPFTIEQYKITAFDTVRAMLFLLICLVLIFGVYLLVVVLSEKIKQNKKRRKAHKEDHNR